MIEKIYNNLYDIYKRKLILKFCYLFTTLWLCGCVNCIYTPRESSYLTIDKELSNKYVLEKIREEVPEFLANSTKKEMKWRRANVTEFDIKKGIIKINEYSDHDHAGFSARIKRINPEKLKITIKGVDVYCQDLSITPEIEKLKKSIDTALKNGD